jgi:hypothetical protein
MASPTAPQVSETGGYPRAQPQPASLRQHFREYARERPEIVALWCFGIGFVLGWKLKPR